MPTPGGALILALLLAGAPERWACENATVSTQLAEQLLSTYERETRPNASTATNVSLSLKLGKVRIDEDTATAVLLGYIFMEWTDPRLSWNSSDWGGAEIVWLDEERLWRPDLVLLNAADGASPVELPRVMVSASGAAQLVVPLEARAPCALDLAAWPHDTHHCLFKFGSRRFGETALDLKLLDYDTMEPEQVGPWEAVDLIRSSVSEDRETERYSAVQWLVMARRRGGAHAAAGRAVVCALVVLLVGAALLPAEARAPLHAAAVFAAAAWLAGAAVRLPHASTAPALLCLQAALLVLATVAALAAGIVARLKTATGRPSPTLRRLLERTATLSSYSENGCNGRKPWAAVAWLLDMTLHVIGALVLLLLLCIYL